MQCPKRRVYTPKNVRRWKKSKTPVILCAIHHRQNPIKSTYSYYAYLRAILGIETEPQALEYRTMGKVQKPDNCELSRVYTIVRTL
jgi:hypothetical protein